MRAMTFLYVVLGIAILLQVSYPLLSGEPLRLVTISTVYWGAAAMALHALLAYGPRYAFTFLLATLTFALVVESIGVTTGWPFGVYEYDYSLGVQIFSVPLVVPFAWAMIAHPVLVAVRTITKNWGFLYGGLTLMAWDLFLYQQMVRDGRWTWDVTGAHVPFTPEVPLSNALGWLLTGMALIAMLNFILPRDRRKESASLFAADIFLGWSLFAGIVSNLFFFHRPGIALLGGLVLGILLTPYFFIRWLGRP
jgi:putative membrane protein